VLFVAVCQKEQKTLIAAGGAVCGCMPEGTEDADFGCIPQGTEGCSVAECHGKPKELHVAKCNRQLKTLQVSECYRNRKRCLLLGITGNSARIGR